MDKERMTKAKGDQWVGEGFYTTDHNISREIRVIHYDRHYDVHIAIGPQGFKKAKGSIGMTIDQAEDLELALSEAIEMAREHA